MTHEDDWLGAPLGEILIELGVASPDQITEALQRQSETGKKLGELVHDRPGVLRALACQRGLQYLDSLTQTAEELEAPEGISQELTGLIVGTSSRESVGWIAGRRGDRLVVVVSDPTDTELLERLWASTDRTLEILVAPPEVIRARALAGLPNMGGPSEDSVLDLSILGDEEAGLEEIADTEDISEQSLRDDTYPVARLVNWLLYRAVREGASDIHLEARGPSAVSVKLRIDGVLAPLASRIRPHHLRYLVSRIKVLAELDIAETRVPQDGRFRARISGREIDFRVSILPTIHGEAAVLRVLDTKSSLLSIDSLGLDDRERVLFMKNIRKPYGMILVSGPTGSGKTTTLYAAMQAVYREEEKFITIEDPVEYELPGVTQIPVNIRRGLSFAAGLRSIVRQDPDKILVGEIRDGETASIAVNAAMTGHLVLSTIHANNVIDSIGRLGYLGVDPYQFASSFNLVMAQRLIRVLCKECKQDHSPSHSELEALGLDVTAYGRKLYSRASGCEACHGTGYRGRQSIFEMAAITDRLRELIIQRASLLTLRDAAKEEGMTELREACRRLVDLGITSLVEMNRVTQE